MKQPCDLLCIKEHDPKSCYSRHKHQHPRKMKHLRGFPASSVRLTFRNHFGNSHRNACRRKHQQEIVKGIGRRITGHACRTDHICQRDPKKSPQKLDKQSSCRQHGSSLYKRCFGHRSQSPKNIFCCCNSLEQHTFYIYCTVITVFIYHFSIDHSH